MKGLSSCLSLDPFEEVPRRLFPCIVVCHDHALHHVVLVENPNHALEGRLAERAIDHISRVISHHLHHVVIHDFLIDLFEPQEILPGEVGAMSLTESLDDLREAPFLFLGVV